MNQKLRNQQKLALAQRSEQKRAAAYLVFQSPSGQKVLEDLRSQFAGRSIVPGDPYMTHYREGSREVVMFIEDMLKLAETGETDDVDTEA